VTDEDVSQLLRKSIDGDRSALERLLLNFHDPLFHYAQSLLPSDEPGFSAEDVLQETLVEAFRRMRSLDARGSAAFFAWLKSVAKSKFLNLIEAQQALKRGGGRARVVESSASAETSASLLDQIPADQTRLSALLYRKESLGAIAGALGELDVLDRELIHLRFQKGLTFAEIAEKLSSGESAVKMAIHRILKKLRESIAGSEDFSAGL
jgi:RNA polymerase sigma factor (sigma-70 family)